MSLIMQFSLILLVVLITLTYADINPVLVSPKPNIIIKRICPFFSCSIRCKRYIYQNNCPTCECNPCVFGNPIWNVTCGGGDRQCAFKGGICKHNPWTDKVYCCPNEHEGCCPYTPNLIFLCFPRCNSDSNCKEGEKCCGKCPRRCVDAVIP
ncbi:unnamed protein product [Rotaria sp. Silwood2]|nr:unnamed protein product [Rotaria sp. Silwood2]